MLSTIFNLIFKAFIFLVGFEIGRLTLMAKMPF